MSHARCGEPAAKHFARFYLLLLKANSNEADAALAKSDAKAKTPKADPKKKTAKTKVKNKAEDTAGTTSPAKPPPAVPELHINVQLHISPESSADQIDKIFESMAKHLKDFNK